MPHRVNLWEEEIACEIDPLSLLLVCFSSLPMHWLSHYNLCHSEKNVVDCNPLSASGAGTTPRDPSAFFAALLQASANMK
jgi:hypothetical protein